MKATPKVISKTFQVRIEGPLGPLKWVIAYIPFDVKEIWGSRRVRVRGEINGFPFAAALFPTRDGRHFLLVNKAMQKGACVRSGDTAKVRIENDVEERQVVVPAELERQLKQSKALRKWFDALRPSIRRDLATRVSKPKSAEARKRQAEILAELLYSAMDAERDLPPFLKLAFARRPLAFEGWQSMSATHRKHHLLGIFYYRSPEARARRVEKTLEEAEKRVEKARE